MSTDLPPDDSPLDRPEVVACLFYPRPGFAQDPPANACDLTIPVAEGVVIGARCHLANPEAANILLFHTGPLLRRIGVDLAAVPGFEESQGFRQLDKIRAFAKPTLVIHAEYDHLIPFTDGQALYDASPAPDKHLLKIPRADHNTIFAIGLRPYLDSVESFADPHRFGLAPVPPPERPTSHVPDSISCCLDARRYQQGPVR